MAVKARMKGYERKRSIDYRVIRGKLVKTVVFLISSPDDSVLDTFVQLESLYEDANDSSSRLLDQQSHTQPTNYTQTKHQRAILTKP